MLFHSFKFSLWTNWIYFLVLMMCLPVTCPDSRHRVIQPQASGSTALSTPTHPPKAQNSMKKVYGWRRCIPYPTVSTWSFHFLCSHCWMYCSGSLNNEYWRIIFLLTAGQVVESNVLNVLIWLIYAVVQMHRLYKIQRSTGPDALWAVNLNESNLQPFSHCFCHSIDSSHDEPFGTTQCDDCSHHFKANVCTAV